jgi:hypothetical protein
MAVQGRPISVRRKEEPQVGIFWVVRGNLLIDGTSLSHADAYGDHLTHPRGHVDVWEQFQQKGLVFPEMEYEEYPRGRVMYSTKTRRFLLLADRCILRDKGIVSKILSELKLPSGTETGTDEHYRCSICLRSGLEVRG